MVALLLVLGACTAQVPADQTTGVTARTLGPCDQGTASAQTSSEDVVVAPSVDSLLADMRTQQVLMDCKLANGLPITNAQTVAAPPPVAQQAPPTLLLVQTQTPEATPTPPPPPRPASPPSAPVAASTPQYALHTQSAAESWLATQQILNRPYSSKETQALYVSLCKSGDQSSCLMAQALGQKLR